MPAVSHLPELLGRVDKFVAKHKGEWNHTDWEQLLADMHSLGYPFGEDECKRNLGNILEGCKFFYHNAPAVAAAPAKKAPAKKKG